MNLYIMNNVPACPEVVAVLHTPIVYWGVTHQAYRYRLYLTQEQELFFAQVAGCCRLVYNLGLEQRERAFKRTQRTSLRYASQRKELKDLKEAAPFLKDVPHHCIQEALVDLEAAYTNLFKDISKAKAGLMRWEDVRRPAYRKRLENDSFRFPDAKQFRIEESPCGRWASLVLPKLGKTKNDHGAVRARLHRPYYGTIKSITIKREGHWWYASVLTEEPDVLGVTHLGSPAGVDMGIKNNLTLSDGRVYDLGVNTCRRDERKRRLQQRVARAERGSSNYRKAKAALRGFEAKQARRRADKAERVSTELVKNHDVLILEGVNLLNMTASAKGTRENPGRNVKQKSGLNRALLDVGFGRLRALVKQKAPRYGAQVMLVPAAFTSQRCSACGHTSALNRASRDVFHCVRCGLSGCADTLAAQNILALGLLKLRKFNPEDIRVQPAEPSTRYGVETGTPSRE